MRISFYLLVGVVLGSFLGVDIFDAWGGLIRQIALVIILMRVGLALDFGALRRVGRVAVLLSFLPACLEILGMVVIAPVVFGVTFGEAVVLGCVVAAVSPAVIVPRMLRLIEGSRSAAVRRVAQVVMAAGSFDDLIVILLFSVALAFGGDGGVDFSLVWGLLLSLFVSLFVSIVVLRRSDRVASFSRGVLGRLWFVFEPLLFVSVGAQVDLDYALGASFGVVGVLGFVVVWRLVGVFVSTFGGGFTLRERFFCMIAYIPKATVQAAIGAVPLAMGLGCGDLALSFAVLAILVTAPLGAFLIR